MDTKRGEMSEKGTLTGVMSGKGTLTGVITYASTSEYPTYDGEVVADPDFNGIVLQTSNKVLKSNITVNPIRVERTTNLSGGLTVYIGGI